MARNRGKDTGPEVRVRSYLHRSGLRFRKHVKDLPGTPDIVFARARVVVFVDGDFWHGYRFADWQDQVSDFWKRKISGTRSRDRENRRKLRSSGWTVIRLWEHQIEQDFDGSIQEIVSAVSAASRAEASVRISRGRSDASSTGEMQ